MAFYRNISMSFWTDSKVDDEFTPEDKYFFLYLMTNPHTNICGCYEISMKQMERETGYNTDTVKRLLHRMEKMHNVIRYSENTKEVLIVNWGKYNWSASEKVQKAVNEVAEHIKHEQFRKYVIDRVSIGYTYDMDSVSIPNTYDMDTTITDTVTEYRIQNTENRLLCADNQKKTKRFTPPTVEEVQAYCSERRNNVDAEKFVSYYTSNGWKVGRNAMKDWRAAVITWERKCDKKNPETENRSFDVSDLDKLMNCF